MSSRKAVVRLLFLGIALWGCVSFVRAQQFYNLTADEVRIDSVLPRFSCTLPLPREYADSAYQVHIAYPEFIEMTPADIASYLAITQDSLPEMPVVHTQVVVSRKEGSLEASLVPLAYRDGKYCMLVSFMLQVEARPLARRARQVAGASQPADRYAASSVLAEGRWVKIRVPSTGIYELSDALLRKAAGALVPEKGCGQIHQPGKHRVLRDGVQPVPDALGQRALGRAHEPPADRRAEKHHGK